MNFWTRNVAIARMSFDVVRKDPEMLLFPIIGSVLSIVFSVAMLFPTVFFQLMGSESDGSVVWGPLQYAASFATYFGLAFITTFSNVCIVYTTKTRLEGGDATFGQSIAFAFTRLGKIFTWSLISATVGMLLHALENSARNARGAAKIVLAILRSLLATAWTIITLFVVPVIVYKNLGPIDAIKESMATLRQTWGDSLVRHYGMGFLSALFIIAGVAGMFAVGFGISAGLPPTLGMILFGVLGFYLLAVILLFGVANSVYNTALYHYATHGQVPAGFTSETIQGAFVRVR